MKESAPRRLTLRKSSRLHHKMLVDSLFSKGNSIYRFPLRVMWRRIGSEELDGSFRCGAPQGIGQLQMMVTVPKKKRRRAVDRVLMRRRIREAFRLNSSPLREYLAGRDDIRTLSIAFIYIATENLSYSKIERRMISLLAQVRESLENTPQP